MNRSCGECTLCCRLLPVHDIAKPHSTKCKHQFSGGCRIHGTREFPLSCQFWSCRWLFDEETAKLRRPDRTGYVIDLLPDVLIVPEGMEDPYKVNGQGGIVVWCDPERPNAWEDQALLNYVDGKRRTMLIRYGSHKCMVAIPPSMSGLGYWLTTEEVELTEERQR